MDDTGNDNVRQLRPKKKFGAGIKPDVTDGPQAVNAPSIIVSNLP